jgi:ComF family protein
VFCDLASGPTNCCPGCRADLPWISNACDGCGVPLPAGYPGPVCAHCRPDSPGFDRIISALIYEYPVDRLVSIAKFKSRPDSASALGELLGHHLRDLHRAGRLCLPDLIIPVPLHRIRLARRGYNQAAEIARSVGEMLMTPVSRRDCRRIRNTTEQSRLSGRQRTRNLSGAFVASVTLRGRRIAVVDDVLTTGETASAVAAALHEVGAAEVQVWTVARAVIGNLRPFR